MQVLDAPNEYAGTRPCVFLAGSVSDELQWQLRFAALLDEVPATICNPRNNQLAKDDYFAKRHQIEWEHRHMARAALVVFWLTPHTPCPVALFELGICCESGVPLVVGIDPRYALRGDISIQLSLRRPEMVIHDNLRDLAAAVLHSLQTLKEKP